MSSPHVVHSARVDHDAVQVHDGAVAVVGALGLGVGVRLVPEKMREMELLPTLWSPGASEHRRSRTGGCVTSTKGQKMVD